MVLAGGNDQCALIEELRKYFNGDVEIVLVDISNRVKGIYGVPIKWYEEY